MVTIGGTDYPIRFTMGAWRDMEEEKQLPLRELGGLLRDEGKRAGALVAMLSCLIRAGGGVRADMPETDLLQLIGKVTPEEVFPAMMEANRAMTLGMRTADAAGTKEKPRDPLLEELDRLHGDREGVTWRQAAAWGLIAGLGWAEMMDMAPGLVIDLFMARQKYDDTQHGIKRKER